MDFPCSFCISRASSCCESSRSRPRSVPSTSRRYRNFSPNFIAICNNNIANCDHNQEKYLLCFQQKGCREENTGIVCAFPAALEADSLPGRALRPAVQRTQPNLNEQGRRWAKLGEERIGW